MKFRNIVIFSLILFAVLTRIIPHPPNMAPITGIALFSANSFKNKKLVFLIPLVCMFISDIFLGFHSIIPFVYLSFIFISCIGIIRKKININTIFMSSLTFFIVTNFGVWLFGYPHTFTGFISCYTLALPFFINTLLGDFLFSGVLFFTFSKLEKKYPILLNT